MGLIDSILNVACVLLWINWRTAPIAVPEKPSPLSLVATLQKPASRRGARWLSLLALVALLVIRALFYWNLASAVNWTPTLELGAVSLPFRNDIFLRSFLFSWLSFALALGVFFAWLLLMSVVNRNVPSEQPLQRLVRLHLGFLERWPIAAKLLLPALLSTLLWPLMSPGFVRLGIVPVPGSAMHVWQQGVVLGLTSALAWEFLILAICALYLLNSYIYFGESPFWSYVHVTGSNLFQPLRRIPLRIGKVDLAPVLGMALVLVVSHWARQWLPRLFQQVPL
jgi:uncharacterized protein YggT (Ycf19 family)